MANRLKQCMPFKLKESVKYLGLAGLLFVIALILDYWHIDIRWILVILVVLALPALIFWTASK